MQVHRLFRQAAAIVGTTLPGEGAPGGVGEEYLPVPVPATIEDRGVPASFRAEGTREVLCRKIAAAQRLGSEL